MVIGKGEHICTSLWVVNWRSLFSFLFFLLFSFFAQLSDDLNKACDFIVKTLDTLRASAADFPHNASFEYIPVLLDEDEDEDVVEHARSATAAITATWDPSTYSATFSGQQNNRGICSTGEIASLSRLATSTSGVNRGLTPHDEVFPTSTRAGRNIFPLPPASASSWDVTTYMVAVSTATTHPSLLTPAANSRTLQNTRVNVKDSNLTFLESNSIEAWNSSLYSKIIYN